MKRRFLPFLILALIIFFLGKLLISPFYQGLGYFPEERFEKTRMASHEPSSEEEPSPAEEIKKRRINFLVVGVDDVEGTSRSDTLIVGSLDLDRQDLWLLSIPRDTRVEIGEHGFQKLGHAYAYGGIELVKSLVSKLLDISIDYHAVLDYEGFEKIVDTMGGVEMDVDTGMFYEDKSAGFTIDIEPGIQRLSGKKALEYVRFRSDGDGDIGRIQRQMKFMRAAANQWVNFSLIWKSPSLLQTLISSVRTDMTFPEAMALAGFAGNFEKAKLFTAKLPGDAKYIDEISYWVMDGDRTKILVDKFFYGNGVPENPRIEVLNGSGVPGAAGRVSSLLKEKGFNVVGTGDAWSFDFKETIIVDKVGSRQVADELGKLLGASVSVDYGAGTKYSDIMVIVAEEE
jgi:LCP family protein required for cell wall assembly